MTEDGPHLEYAIYFKDMMTYMTDSNREKILSSDSTKLDTHFSTHSKPVLGTIMTLTCLFPMLFCSCGRLESHSSGDTESRMDEPVTFMTAKGLDITCIKGLDIFTFDDDRLGRLDSYQVADASGYERIRIHSRSGDKIVFISANSMTDRYGWGKVTSLRSLDDFYADLTDEDPYALLMNGTCRIKAGDGTPYEMDLRPLASEICLRSISCDFSGKSYAGAQLKNVSVYLTNVNTRCSITAEGAVKPTHIINNGMLNEDDIATFRYPETVFQRLGQTVGNRKVTADIRLYCYPNSSEKEGPGTPCTRLVIEGDIDGETYWWPIEVNGKDDDGEKGIYRNCRYVYDIVIRRKGMTDPDITIDTEDIDISIERKAWNEKDSYQILF